MYYHSLLDQGIDPTDYYDNLRDMWPDLSHVPEGNDIRSEDGLLPNGGPVPGLCSRCGEPHDNWPDGSGGKLCQECWEATGDLPPCAFVPGEVADILRPLVDEVHWARYGSEDDEQRAALVRYWLDSQRPAPGQGGNDGNV